MFADVNYGALDNLVKQFSSAFDCLRELVQNAIDAGTPRVDVWTEFSPGEGHLGAIAVHVDDYGEGMNEKIIDDELTRLFASSKEGDLTKIGKFGIGFVSVFALEPRGVLVVTGRGGERWEVFFHEDRTFTKTRIESPVEGTQVTLFLEGDLARYREIVVQSRAALDKWCCHSETEVSFEDRSPPRPVETRALINQRFEVPGELFTRVTHPGSEIVLAYNDQPLYGFYNRGLTLAFTRAADQVLDQRGARFGHIAVKMKSKYLEHTLSRETVLRDDNYEKAMQLLDAAASGPLLARLLDRLEQLAAAPAWSIGQLHEYGRLAWYLSREPGASFLAAQERAILRTVDGRALTSKIAFETLARDGRVLLADAPSPMTELLREQEIPVLLGRPVENENIEATEALSTRPLDATRAMIYRALVESVRIAWQSRVLSTSFVSWFLGEDPAIESRVVLASPDDVYIPVIVDNDPSPEHAWLLHAASYLLESTRSGYRRLTTCTPSAPLEEAPLFVVGRRLSRVMARPPQNVAARKRGERLEVAVNRRHPQFRALFELSKAAPEMAAYCLAKDLLLEEDRLHERDLTLISAALDGLGVDRG